MTAFGQLRIVPSADMGELGPHEGQASTFQWHWRHSMAGLLLWLALIAAAIGIKANRNYRTLLLLVPLAVVTVLYLALKQASGMPSSSAVQFDLFFYSLAAGVTLLWLVAPVLERLPAVARILAAIVSMLVVANLGIVSFGTASAQETTVFLAIFGFIGAALVLTPAAAARLSRQTWRPGVFMLWLAVWMIVGSVVALLATMAVLMMLLPDPGASEIPRLLGQAILFGAVLGVCLYLLQLPYMLLGLVSPFYRARLQRCLNLKRPVEGDGG